MGRAPAHSRPKQEIVNRQCECCGKEMHVRLRGYANHFKSWWTCDKCENKVRYKGWRLDKLVTVS